MAYTKVGWKDYPDTTTPVNAANLNQMDQGIADNASSITTQSEQIAEVQSDISQINTDLSELNIKMDDTLANDYNGATNTSKGIKFDQNADGSYFTFRPYLPSNILQVTKNDTSGLLNISSSGNVEVLGTLTAKGVKLSGIYITSVGTFGSAITTAFSLPCTNDHIIAFMCMGTNLFGSTHITDICIGSNNKQAKITRDAVASYASGTVYAVYWV